MSLYFKNKYRIPSSRYSGYNYSQSGWYFITICTYKRICCLGNVIRCDREDAYVELSEIGKIIKEEWLKTEKIRPNVFLDKWVIMPNHLHGIIMISDAIENVETHSYASL